MDPFSIHKGDRILNQELGISFKRDKKVKDKPGRPKTKTIASCKKLKNTSANT